MGGSPGKASDRVTPNMIVFESTKLPAATEDPPHIAGITIISSRDAGSKNIWEFKINRGEEEAAIQGLLNSLDEIEEFALAVHSRGDYESGAIYRKDGKQFKMKVGGHGWSGEWEPLDRESAIAEARKQLQYNYGATSYDCGDLVKYK